MAVYSQSMLNTLQGYITSAQTALAAGDTDTALVDINLYYGAQVNLRGYASDALNVEDNIGIFGATANQRITSGQPADSGLR